ncbi:hypothetical protein EDB81DRAFT_678150 [Dactylonectria macrodidyma]|uniref:Uncharacterized protein n=1 Tax=Dactylonectria macrodidyma TaxID=307937 RepID=A0A9P9JHW9_9HYPO|nr:hypothetical protein EDB81DRAFT_678150 [Dactylonectria macrodidyma]
MSLNPRKTWTEWTTILSDFMTVVLPLSLLLFVVIVASTDNKQIDGRFEDFINALTVLATAFPILFAFILGRLLYQMARLNLENGASLGTLEQLMGSRTLGASFATHFQLRLFNWRGFLLLSTWSLSPIGGQSLLRCLNIEPGFLRQTGFYFDTLNPVGVNTGLFFDNAAYSTALVSPQAIREGPMDLWGNYSSLVGIPTSNIPAGNTTFTIESTYMRLNCSELEAYPLYSVATSFIDQETILDDTLENLNMVNASTRLANGTWYGHQHNATDKRPRFWNLALDRFVDNCWWNGSHSSSSDVFTPTFGVFESETDIEAGPTNLLFQARINMTSSNQESETERTVVKSRCRVLQEYVESSIDCSRGAGSSTGTCKVISQRKSKRKHPTEDLTSISQPMDFKTLSNVLPKLIVSQNNDATTDPLLIYLYMSSLDELDRWESIPDLSTVGKFEFSARLSQLINSYVVLSGASMAIIPQFFKSTVPNSDAIKAGIKMTQTETTDLFYYYTISWPWMVACLFSCGVLVVGGIFSVIYAHSANGPEVLGFVSTSFRDSKYVSIPPGAEHVDGSKLSEMMKDERFRYGYTSDQDGVYRVGIAHEKDTTKYG